MSCQTLVSCASRPEAKETGDAGQVLDSLVPGDVRRPGGHGGHVPEAEAQDVDVVDGVLNEATAAGLGHVGPPLRGVGTLNGEVLVVAEDGGHGGAELARSDEIAQRPEDRRAAQYQPALTGHPSGVDGVDQGLCSGQVDGERLLAEDGASGREGLVDGVAVGCGRSAHPDGIATRRYCGRVSRRLSTHGLGERPGSALTLVVDSLDRRVDHPAVDHGLESQPVGPTNETRPDESDPHHEGEATRCGWVSGRRARRPSATRP